MADNLLLLADRRSFRQLRSAPLLDSFLVDGEAPDWNRPGLAAHPQILRRDPLGLLPDCPYPGLDPEENAGVLRRSKEAREELFSQLLQSTVCHLLVLENPASLSRAQADKLVLADPEALSRLAAWYRGFREEAALRTGPRREEFRHVLILVCADDLPADGFRAFADLLEARGSDCIIHQCYVMLRHLNWDRADICHSRYVWPIAVSRLLLRLAVGEVPEDESTTTRAWRAVEIVPDVSQEVVRQTFLDALDELRGNILAPAEGQETEWGAEWSPVAPDIKVPELAQLPDMPNCGQWQSFPAGPALRGLIDESRWKHWMAQRGAMVGDAYRRFLLESEPPMWEEVTQVWQMIHGNAAVLASARSHSSALLLAGPDVQGQLKQGMENWQGLIESIEKHRTEIEDGEACASVLKEAQDGFVGRGIRAWLALAAGVAVAWFGSLVIYHLLGSWLPAALVGLSAIAGALLAAVVPYVLERWSGEKAVDRYIDEVLSPIRDSKLKQESVCRQMVGKSYEFCLAARSASVARRLRLLVKRVYHVLTTEMSGKDPHVQGEPGADDLGIVDRDGEQAERRRRQWTIFQDATRICSQNQAFIVRNEELVQVVIDHGREFATGWNTFCSSHDKELAGHLPVRHLVPWLRDFRRRFRTAVAKEFYAQAGDAAVTQAEPQWLTDLEQHRGAMHLYFMSCPVTDDEIDSESLVPSLFLRCAADTVRIEQQLEMVDVQSCLPSQAPLIGLYYEEVPIRLGVQNGYITAVKYAS